MRADPTQRYIERGNLKPGRQRNVPKRAARRHFDIRHFPAGLTKKMTVLPHIRTKARRTAVQRDLPEQPASHQHAQAIVNRRERNFRHPPLHSLENFVRSRVIVAFRDDFEDLTALTRKTKTGRLERMLQPLAKRGLFEGGNSAFRITFGTQMVNRDTRRCYIFLSCEYRLEKIPPLPSAW